MSQSSCGYPVEPTDEEENQERWLASIQSLPDDFDRSSLMYMWDQPPSSWAIQNMSGCCYVNISLYDENLSIGNIISRGTRLLRSYIPNFALSSATRSSIMWTLNDPNMVASSGRSPNQFALVERRILLVCPEGDHLPSVTSSGWLSGYPRPYSTDLIGHEHSWDCIQQIWVSEITLTTTH
jgi:hypothetical protein